MRHRKNNMNRKVIQSLFTSLYTKFRSPSSNNETFFFSCGTIPLSREKPLHP